jgi:hypothetical protein
VTDDYFASPRPPQSSPYPQSGVPYQPQSSSYGAPYGQQHPGWAAPQASYGPPRVPETNALAIVALVLAIMGLGPIAAIVGHIARGQIRHRGDSGDGLALAGIIVGWITTALWVAVCGLFAFGAAVGGA